MPHAGHNHTEAQVFSARLYAIQADKVVNNPAALDTTLIIAKQCYIKGTEPRIDRWCMQNTSEHAEHGQIATAAEYLGLIWTS